MHMADPFNGLGQQHNPGTVALDLRVLLLKRPLDRIYVDTKETWRLHDLRDRGFRGYLLVDWYHNFGC